MASGPLVGVKVVEFAGIGPGSVLRDAAGGSWARTSCGSIGPRCSGARARPDLANRGKRSVAIDLKKAEGVEAALSLMEKADALIEGFRPGVMERLGARAGCGAEAQPAARLWAHDRVGADGALVEHGGA
jgi:alpha-methylacyl-CoA racemase